MQDLRNIGLSLAKVRGLVLSDHVVTTLQEKFGMETVLPWDAAVGTVSSPRKLRDLTDVKVQYLPFVSETNTITSILSRSFANITTQVQICNHTSWTSVSSGHLKRTVVPESMRPAVGTTMQRPK